jgi:hypothetical protein
MSQTQRDDKKINEWISRSSALFAPIEECLWNFRFSALLEEAMAFWRAMSTKGIPCKKPGRLEHRRSDALICWFCDNHADVLQNNFVVDLSVSGLRANGRGRRRIAKNSGAVPSTPFELPAFSDDESTGALSSFD